MRAALKHLMNDIKLGENIDIYITLFLSVALAILGVFGVIQTTILSAGILATLSVLTYTMLTTRRLMHDVSQTITSLQSVADIGLKDREALSPLKERMAGVNTIWLLGPSLVNLWPPNDHFFFEKVRNGGEIRLLISNPESLHLPIIAEQVRRRPDSLKMDIRKTLDTCRELVQGGLGTGKFDVRMTEMIPGYSMVVSDPSKPSGHIMVEFLGYRSHLDERPHLELDVSKHHHWFNFYFNQYNELWKSATPYKFDGST